MISEPYKDSSGAWWVTHEGNSIAFPTSEEAYHFYHRLIDIGNSGRGVVPPTELTPRTPSTIEPVKVTPLPERPYWWPFPTENDYLNAVEEEREKDRAILKSEQNILLLKAENERLKKGEIPLSVIWWKLALGGIGGLILGVVGRGCL